MWELVVVYGITTSGIGGHFEVPMKDENTCYMAAVNTNIQEKVNRNDGTILIYCREKMDGEEIKYQ
jgi:hypothetical protein